MSQLFPNYSSYPNLSNYAVLASSGITSAGTTTITNGTYGSSPTPSYTGTINGVVDSGNAGSAQAPELVQLRGAIGIAAGSRPQIILGTVTNDIVLYPTNTYLSGSLIIFQGKKITLDAQGDPNAQFFILAETAITFASVPSITLIHGATNCNVFWGAGPAAITFTGTNPPYIPGVFIAGTSITFDNACNVSGRLYAETGNVTFRGTSFVDATCGVNPDPNAQSNICFPAGTPVQTDQGLVNIELLDKNIHTIANNNIVAITKTVTLDKYLISFPQNTIGYKIPSQTTIMSKDHKIDFKGQLVPAERFLDFCSEIKKVKYNGQVLYNVLLEKHGRINVNGMICETLHPENIIAKLYTNGYTDEERINIIYELNDSLNKKSLPMYKNVLKRIEERR
jgi:hypothetical protein